MDYSVDDCLKTNILFVIIPEDWVMLRGVRGERDKGNVLFNDTLNTFIYGYLVSDIL